jgi:Raf kinase inhibitor-like YbhB/YbcL family protein
MARPGVEPGSRNGRQRLKLLRRNLLKGEDPMLLELLSDAFASGGTIPVQYTCEGENLSPPLAFRGVPAEAKSLMLICDDPDAPTGIFTHWVVYDLRASLDGLPKNVGAGAAPGNGSSHGRNDLGHNRYDGPCPPCGNRPHRYYFHLYALDQPLALSPGATRAQVMEGMQGHILAQAEVMGRFGRG